MRTTGANMGHWGYDRCGRCRGWGRIDQNVPGLILVSSRLEPGHLWDFASLRAFVFPQ